jgi:hypothetical protein
LSRMVCASTFTSLSWGMEEAANSNPAFCPVLR